MHETLSLLHWLKLADLALLAWQKTAQLQLLNCGPRQWLVLDVIITKSRFFISLNVTAGSRLAELLAPNVALSVPTSSKHITDARCRDSKMLDRVKFQKTGLRESDTLVKVAERLITFRDAAAIVNDGCNS